jgi:hypothetical protein
MLGFASKIVRKGVTINFCRKELREGVGGVEEGGLAII